MTPESKRELLAAVGPRYRKANKTEKTRILNEFVANTGYHRKYAIQLLRQGRRARLAPARPGRPRVYPREVDRALRFIWETCDRICGQRLQPFIPEMITVLARHGELVLPDPVQILLCQMSAATIDRHLAPVRRQIPRRGLCTTKPGTLLKRQIPIRTGTEWDENQPGFTEIDLVAHGGDSAAGEFIHTLDMVDVCTGWTECQAIPNRGQLATFTALLAIQDRLPFPLRGIDSDNGAEFINQHLYRYCQREQIAFTRGRPYRKNDQAHVEQKNWAVVRRLVGYDRYESPAALAALNEFYQTLRLYLNFFLPVLKLASKTRVDGQLKKKYDTARTPYQRVLAAPEVAEEAKAILRETYETLNPVRLRQQLDDQLEQIWALAVR